MINLIDYIAHPNHINVYFDEEGYWIDNAEWDDAIYELDGTDVDGNFHEYLYNVAAGKLCKEIYRRTQAEEIRMFCNDGKIRKYRWAAHIGAYYNKVTHVLI